MSQITLKPLDDGQTAVVIPLGKTTIGRGSLLGCSDKKVSRNHAVLEVTSKGEVYLTPTHVNPCFYQPSADNPGQILKKDVPHKLENGDSFSLLPRAYRYQLSVVDKEQNDLNKGKTNGSTGDGLEDIRKEPAKGVMNVEPTETTPTEKPHVKSDPPPDKKPPKDDNNPKRSPPSSSPEDNKKDKEPSPPKENNVLHKETPTEEKEINKEEEEDSKEEGDSNHVGEDDEDDKKGEKEVVKGEEEDKKEEEEEDKKATEDSGEDKRAESCEESRDEGTLDTLPSKVSEGEEEGSKPAKRGGRKKAVKPPPEEKNVSTKRKAVSAPRGRKKKTPAATKFDFGPGEEGNSSQRVAGRTSSRTNRQTRQGLSLEDFIVSDDEEWQSDHSSPKRRRKKRGSRRNDDSGSDWEVDHKKPKKTPGVKGGSGSESGSDWGTPKKKGAPKGRRKKGAKAAESEEVASEGEEEEVAASASAPKQRIPCTYGKKCYRRNQNHVEQFSHPGDSDYASDGETEQKAEEAPETESVKKECPYGANCFRKNAQHKKDFKHTKKVRPQRKAAELADKKAKGSKTSEEVVDSYDLNDSLLNEDSADEYKQVDSGSDYEHGERSKKLAKAKGGARGGGKRGRRA